MRKTIVTLLSIVLALFLSFPPLTTAKQPKRTPPIQMVDWEEYTVNQGVIPFKLMREHHANTLRIVMLWNLDKKRQGNIMRVVKEAKRRHIRVYLTVQYNDTLSVKQATKTYLNRVQPYLRYVWAVSVGSEQEGPSPKGESPHHYRQVWDRVAPTLKKKAPHVIRVFGEVTPWGGQWMKYAYWDSFDSHKRAKYVQAFSIHPYWSDTLGLRDVPQLAKWAAKQHLPLYLSETCPDLYWTNRWIHPRTLKAYNQLLAKIVKQYPSVKVIGFYYWDVMLEKPVSKPPVTGKPGAPLPPYQQPVTSTAPNGTVTITYVPPVPPDGTYGP
jgi:hypothetical protein